MAIAEQQVKKGDLLAVIDPRPFQAALDQTKATLAKDEAALADAKTNLERYAALVKEHGATGLPRRHRVVGNGGWGRQ